MQLENIYKSTRFAMANVPNSFRDFFQWGVRMKLCLSIFGTLAIHYGKGQLIPKDFQISQQNIASLGNNWAGEVLGQALGCRSHPSIPRTGEFQCPMDSWKMIMSEGEKQEPIFPKSLQKPGIWSHQLLVFCRALVQSSAAPLGALWPPRCHQSHHSLTRPLH